MSYDIHKQRKRDMLHCGVRHISKITNITRCKLDISSFAFKLQDNCIIKADKRQVYILKFVPPFKKGGFFYA